MLEIVVGFQQKLNKKSSLSIDDEEMAKVGEKRKNSEEEFTQSSNNPNGRNIFKNRQVVINMFKKGLREEACQAIFRFFYNNAIPFNMAKSEEFTAMFDLVSRYDLGFKPSSYHVIIVKYLKEEVTNTSLALQSHMEEWKKTRCMIMTNG